MRYLLSLLIVSGVGDPVPDATTSKRGYVNTSTQAFSGLKTFDGGIWTPSINGEIPGPTTSDVYLYLDAAGNDANPCTASLPCLTASRVFSRIPRVVRNPVFIFADAGTYGPDSLVVEGIRIEREGVIFFVGTPVALEPDGGTRTGTLTAVANTLPAPVLTDSSQAWVPNSLRGGHVRITSGTAAGNLALIHANTATTLSLVNIITGTVAIGNTYELITPGTVLTASNGNTDSVNGAPLTIRNVFARAAIAPTTGAYDGGTFGILQFSWVRLKQLGASSGGVRIDDAPGTVVAIDNSAVDVGIVVNGSMGGVRLRQTVVKPANPAVLGFSVGSGAFMNSFLGPFLFDCTGPNACMAFRGRVNFSNATSNVIEIPSTNTVGAVAMIGGFLFAVASTANGAWRINCNGGPGYGIALEGASAALNTSVSQYDSNFLIVENCATALRVSGSHNVGLLTSVFRDAGVAISADRGARIRLNNAPTLTNVTTEMTVDGTVFTFATLNAATPQVVPTTPNPYGTWISR
jgi:hypothetical protein